jgi:hypothetical protein
MQRFNESKLQGDNKSKSNDDAASEFERQQIELALAASLGQNPPLHSSNTSAMAAGTAAAGNSAAANAASATTYLGGVRVDKDGNKLTDEGRVIKAGVTPSAPGLTPAPLPSTGSMADTNRQMDLVIRMKTEFLENMRKKYIESKHAFAQAYKIFLDTQLESYMDLQVKENAEVASKEKILSSLEGALVKKVAELREYLAKVRTDIKVDLPEKMDLQAKIVELRPMMTSPGEQQFLEVLENARKQMELFKQTVAAMKKSVEAMALKVKELSELTVQASATSGQVKSFKAIIKHFATIQTEHVAKGTQAMPASERTLYDKQTELFNTYATSIVYLKQHSQQMQQAEADLQRFKDVRAQGALAEAVEIANAADAAEAAKAAAKK